jgi:3-methylcrotonyl-CoA carboxylase alpha subunit
VGQGDEISPFYDSMVAKLIVWGENREQALARLDAALAQTHIVGLQTNVAFLRRVVNSASFAQADLDTALIERERAALFDAPPLALPWAVAGFVALALRQEAQLAGADPWTARDGWRLSGPAARRFEVVVEGEPVLATLTPLGAGASAAALAINDQAPQLFSAQWPAGSPDTVHITMDGLRQPLNVYALGEAVSVFGPQAMQTVVAHDPIAHAGGSASGGGGRLTAPMPGKLIALMVQAGQAVEAGQALAVMEAMKMEHTLTAPRAGVVSEVLYAIGDQLSEGAELLKLAE